MRPRLALGLSLEKLHCTIVLSEDEDDLPWPDHRHHRPLLLPPPLPAQVGGEKTKKCWFINENGEKQCEDSLTVLICSEDSTDTNLP